MNQKLTEEIAYHILANLGVLPSTFLNAVETKSLTDKSFLLPEKVSFEIEGRVIQKNVYGCQVSVADHKDFKMLLADCTQEKDLPEYVLIAQLKDAPMFGVYLIFNRIIKDDDIDPEALIAVNTDNKHWMPCTTYLQATFLAGMEQLRDLSFGWGKCKDYQEMYAQLLSFIKFHDNFFEVSDEGQEV